MLEKLLSEQRVAFDNEMSAMREALKGQSAEEERAREVVRQEMEARSAAQKKQERIELVTRQMARRMLYRSTAIGFNAWVEMASARSEAMGWLKRAAGRIANRGLSMAFGTWVSNYHSDQYARMQKESNDAAGLAKELNTVRVQLKAALLEKNSLQEKLSAAGNGVAQSERKREEQAAAEREARVELLHRQMTRRMMNQGLASAWTSWYDFWCEKTYALSKLRKVANMLRYPRQADAFSVWVHVYDAVNAKKAAKESMQKTMNVDELRKHHEAELEKERAFYQGRLDAAAEEQRLALEKQCLELTGSAEAVASLKARHEKEERIELLRRQMVRRMMNQGVAFGFSAWKELYEAKVWALSKLKEVSLRLHKPELSNAFRAWLEDQAEEHLEMERREMREQKRGVQAELAEARFQVEQISLHKSALEDEIRALKEKAFAQGRMIDDQAGELERARSVEEAHEELKAQYEEVREALDAMKMAKATSEADWTRRLKENHDLLERLLAEQRQGFDEELGKKDEMRRQAVDEERERGKEERLKAVAMRAQEADATEAALKKERDLASASHLQAVSEVKSLRAARLQAQEYTQTINEEVERLKRELTEVKERVGNGSGGNGGGGGEMYSTGAGGGGGGGGGGDGAGGFVVRSVVKVGTERVERVAKERRARGSVLHALNGLDLDEGPDALPVAQQLADALRKNSARVLDLFRDWDQDGDGEVSRKEFHKAMPILGYDVSKEQMDQLFDEWKSDAESDDDSLSYKELQKILNKSMKIVDPAAAKRRGTMRPEAVEQLKLREKRNSVGGE